MPEAFAKAPKSVIRKKDREDFLIALQSLVAVHMFCEDDETKPDGSTNLECFDAFRHIDASLWRYGKGDARLTAVIMITIVTYAKPSRMANIEDRLRDIANDLAYYVPDDAVQTILGVDEVKVKQDKVSVTFIGKGDGCCATSDPITVVA